MAGGVARPVDQIEHFLGVGQGHDQRGIPPDALVGHVHTLLAAPGGGGDRAVDVEVGHRAEQILAAGSPQLRADRVDRPHQGGDVIGAKPAAEVPGGGRVRDQVRAEGVHVRGVMPQPLDVLQPGPAAGHVVGQVQHVVGLVIRQVHLQQLQVGVDRLGQPEPGHQPMHGGDPAETGRVHVAADLVMHRTRGQHRRRLGTRTAGPAGAGQRPDADVAPRSAGSAAALSSSPQRPSLPGCVETAKPLQGKAFVLSRTRQTRPHAYWRTRLMAAATRCGVLIDQVLLPCRASSQCRLASRTAEKRRAVAGGLPCAGRVSPTWPSWRQVGSRWQVGWAGPAHRHTLLAQQLGVARSGSGRELPQPCRRLIRSRHSLVARLQP